MRRRVYCITIFMMVLFSFLVSGYNQTGDEGNYFRSDSEGYFNDELSTDTTATRALSSPSGVPLVSDLDNDGENEIIVLDDNTLRMYRYSTLAIVDSYSLPSGNEFSNMIAYDIDGDLRREIIISALNAEMLYAIGYNGSVMINDSSINMTYLNHQSGATTYGQMVLACRNVNDCAAVYASSIDSPNIGSPQARYLSTAWFNSSNITGEVQLIDTGSSFSTLCAPSIPFLAVADYDNDGATEYITSWMEYDQSTGDGGDDVHLFWIAATGTSVSEEQHTIDTITDELGGNGVNSNCVGQDIGYYFTAPVVFDIDGSLSNGLETVLAMQLDADTYKMYSYESDGSFLDDYPEVLVGTGRLLSNVIKVNAFTDTEDTDFCVMGFNDDDFNYLTCASETTSSIPETKEFLYESSGASDIPVPSNVYPNMIHAVKMARDETDGNDLDEILTTFGVFAIDYSGTNELNLIYTNPLGNESSMIPEDVEKSGYDDLIGLTDTNVWYIDDGIENSPGLITHYYINPCVNAMWKLNTSVEVRVTVEDIDGDDVNSKVTMYQFTDNEFSSESENLSSGTTFTYSFTANKTGNNLILSMVGRDVQNYVQEDEIIKSYSVGTNGVEYGDCVTETDVVEETTEEAFTNESLTPSDDNIINNGVEEINELTHLGKTLIWLIIIVIINVVLIHSAKDFFKGWGSRYFFALMVIIDVILVVVGVVMGMINLWLILLLLIIAIAAIVIYVVRAFSGGNNG